MKAFNCVLLVALTVLVAACGSNVKSLDFGNSAEIKEVNGKVLLTTSEWRSDPDGLGTKNWEEKPLGNVDWVPVQKKKGSYLAILGKNHILIFRLANGRTGTYRGNDIGFIDEEVVEFRLSDSYHESSKVVFCEFHTETEARWCGMSQMNHEIQVAKL